MVLERYATIKAPSEKEVSRTAYIIISKDKLQKHNKIYVCHAASSRKLSDECQIGAKQNKIHKERNFLYLDKTLISKENGKGEKKNAIQEINM